MTQFGLLRIEPITFPTPRRADALPVHATDAGDKEKNILPEVNGAGIIVFSNQPLNREIRAIF